MATYIPTGAPCEADDDRGSGWGCCFEPATDVVTYQRSNRYVCRSHFLRYTPEKNERSKRLDEVAADWRSEQRTLERERREDQN